MLSTTIKGLLARKRRLITTILAVTLGVAFLAGTLVLTDTIGKTFDNLFSDVYKGTDALVRAKAAFSGPQNTGTQRGRVDASLLPVVARVDGVAVAEGEVLGYARIVAKDGTALGNPAMGAPTFGGNWSGVPQLNPWRLVSGGPPRADDEVVIDRKSSLDGNLVVGDSTTVLTQGGPQHVRVVGVAKFGTTDSPGGASFALFSAPAAQRLVAQPGKFDSINLVARSGVSQGELVQRLRPVLPPGTEAITGKAITKESQSDIRKAFSFFNTFMLVFAVVALLVGGFMIFNTFSITVAQRTRENGLLRALGASRRQVLGSVLGEALAIGVLASLIGLAAGVLVASGLKALLSGFGFDVPAGGVVFTSRTVVVSLLVGVVVTLLAALSPARQAGKVPPVAAMQTEFAGSSGYGSKQRVIGGVAILALGVAALFAGLFGGGSSALPKVGVGVLLVFFGVAVLGRTVSLPLSRVLGAPLPRLRGVSGELARENAMRNPKRTASSASALMIGVGLVGFITILASSTKASINAAIDRAFTGDFVITSGAGFSTGGVDPSLARRLNARPEVASATGIRMSSAKVAGSVKLITGIDPRTGSQVIDVKARQGSLADLGRDAIGVFDTEATDKHLKVGDQVPVVFKDTGTQMLRVALIYGVDQPLGRYVLGIAAYEANVADRFDTQVYVKRANGVAPPAALAAVKQVAKDYPGTKVLDQTQFKAEQSKQVNQLLALIYALLALAILIALLGIGNTLALAIFERTRELGLLRAVGMTRRQLRSTIRWESVIIALQGTVLGLVIGIFFGWALVTALADQGIDRFQVPVPNLVVVAILAGLAGVLAAVGPSRRAAKMNVLEAIATQ